MPLISVVSIGELMSLARQFGWGNNKVEYMREVLGELIVVDINSEPVLSAYAEIDFWCKQNGRAFGKNDLWIAATAIAHGFGVATHNAEDFVRIPGLRVLSAA